MYEKKIGEPVKIFHFSVEVCLSCAVCNVNSFEDGTFGGGKLGYILTEARSQGWRILDGQPICKDCIEKIGQGDNNA